MGSVTLVLEADNIHSQQTAKLLRPIMNFGVSDLIVEIDRMNSFKLGFRDWFEYTCRKALQETRWFILPDTGT